VTQCYTVYSVYMSAYTKEEAQAELVIWKAALKAAASGQSYSVAGRTLNRANLKEIKDMVEWFGQQVNQAERGGRRAVYNIIPMDC